MSNARAPKRTYSYTAFIAQPSAGLKKLTTVRACTPLADVDDQGRLQPVENHHTDPRTAVARERRRLTMIEKEYGVDSVEHKASS